MNRYILLLLLCIPFAGQAQKASGTSDGQLIIEGRLQHVNYPVRYVYIILLDGNTNGTDSVPVIDGRYRFSISTPVSSLVTLYASNPSDFDNLKDHHIFTFFSEPARVGIVSTDSFSNATVSGSKSDITFRQLEHQRKPLASELMRLYKLQSLTKQEDSIRSLRRAIDSTRFAMASMYYRFVQSNRSSPLVPYALSMYASDLPASPAKDQVQQLQASYNRLSTTQQEGYYGRNINRRLNSYRMAIGMTAPAFTQNDTLDRPVSLASFKGRYVLIDFWASWCVPCRQENPAVVKAFNNYSSKGFTVLSVSLDRPNAREKWLEAIRKDGLNWTNVSDLQFWDNKVAKLYHVESIPQNFLVDPSGRIIAKNLRGPALEKKLQSLF